MREFLVEGFVTRSLCESTDDGFLCTSESVESGPGMRSRLRVRMIDAYRFEETFELASPGQELQHYFTIQWIKVPELVK